MFLKGANDVRIGFLMVIGLIILAACQTNEQPQEPPANQEQETETATETNEQSDTDTEDQTENETEDETSSETENNDAESLDDDEYMTTKMDALDFYEIEIEVEYVDGKEYEVEIERDDNRPYTAEVEDELNNIYLKGKEAFDEVYPKIEQLSVNIDSEQTDVIEQVLSVFDLPDNYTKFEIEIKFNDGSEMDFEVKR